MIDPKRKLLRHISTLADYSALGFTGAPINVEIDLSNRCSLGCAWCHFAYTHTRGPLAHVEGGDIPGGDLMDTDLALRIVDQLYANGVRSITWTGGGEPTLHPKFDTVITHAHRTGIPQGLYTNGCHIPRERAWRLKRELTWAYVSLDEIEPEAYARSKGVSPKMYEKAIDGIRELVKAKGRATIGIGILLHEGNAECGPEALALAKSLGVDYVQFRPTILYEMDRPGERIEEAAWVARALDTVPDDPMVSIDRDRFRMYATWEGHGYERCHWSALQTVITPSGALWTCVNRREDRGSYLGSLAEERFDEIWRRQRAHRVDQYCRLMCRGHLANLAIEEMLTPMPHEEFV